MKDRRALVQLQSRLLDSATAALVAGWLYYRPEWCNPWNLSLLEWSIGAAGLRCAIVFYDYLVVLLIEASKAALLPTRTTDKPVRYVELDTTSFVYLSINSLHEWIFVQRLLHYIWYSPEVSKDWNEITIVNTLVALYVMFIVLDVCYAPCHHLLHQPSLYPLIHKHHHRQHYPTRGYLDAGNEHPMEHVVGVVATWCAVLTAIYTTGAHFVTIFTFFNVHAALAMLNHSPYNVFCNVLGIKYSVANHEMHHRKFTVNYAQYCMWYDHVMNTFAPYEGPKVDKTKGGDTVKDGSNNSKTKAA